VRKQTWHNRLRFCLLLDANPRSCFLADPHSVPTGEAYPPVPGAPGVRGGGGEFISPTELLWHNRKQRRPNLDSH
jgi:hypothetical protein